MLKVFEAPEVELIKFNTCDVIATSVDTGNGGLPVMP